MTPEAMEWEKLTPGDAIPLAMHGGTASAHVFEKEMIDAIDFAIAARRPLLVRGEPGTGKSQLARAAAKALGRAFVSKVLDVHTEPRDLFWWLDSVERLADAQILGIGEKEHKTRDVRETLDLKHYIEPGPLWWAFDWKSAEFQAKQARRLAPPPTAVSLRTCSNAPVSASSCSSRSAASSSPRRRANPAARRSVRPS